MAVEPRTRTTSPESAEGVTVPDAAGEADAPPILGHFAIGRRIGGGGMGVVFEARDTVLDRTVALKLVRPGARRGDKARTRLLREAQALARLKHPNVVTVFEVGTAVDEIFIAMELVEGSTLREWMRTAHDWRAIVDVFLGVGRGLAAAHALGLVHRDVKPSNVFLDRDGTPKVGDFGLVSATGAVDDDRDDDSAPQSPLSRTLTTTGSVMGTPAYMAPEQVAGERADARADQFAYCVSLYEALTGQLPGEPSSARPLPPRVKAILARGMDLRADARYPSMDALCADLARVRRGRARLWLAAGATAGVIAIAAGAWTLARARTDDDPCPAPSAAIDPVRGDARRAAVDEHVRAIDHAEGAARTAAIAARLDPYVRGWRDMRVAACRATRVGGAQSDTTLDLRMRCLDRRLAELDDGVALIAAARTVAALDHAVVGLAQLTPIDGCADTAALSAAAPPPEQPEARATADRIARELAQITAREHGGQLDGLAAIARGTVGEARALGHPPTLAAALAELAHVELAVDDTGAGGATLRELTQVAARAHDDRDEAFAWTKLISVVGFDEGKPDEALTLVPAASAAVLRAGEPVDLRSDLLYAQGSALDQGPHAIEGLAKLEQARALLEQAGGGSPDSVYAPRLADVVFETASAKGTLGDATGSIAAYRRAIALWQQLYGPDSPDEAFGWHDLGEELRHDGKLDLALDALHNAVRIRETRIGDSPALAISLVATATVLEDQAHFDAALAAYDRALAMDRTQLAADDPRLVNVMLGRAMTLGDLGRDDEANRGFADAIALLENSGARTSNLPITYFNRAELASKRGHCDAALPDYAKAVSLFEEIDGKRSSYLIYPLVGEGRCLLRSHRAADAIAPLVVARGLTANGLAAGNAALARFYLGRALVETGRDPTTGLADARAARKDLDGTAPAELAEIDRWLAAHR